MASAMKLGPAPRYGSAAQLATYAGLSVKTIRRLVESGSLRGRKVGRRLLIPFEDLDRHILSIVERGKPTMTTPAEATLTHRSIDARGRAIPLSEAERRRWAAEAIRALEALDEMGDEAEQRATLEALMKGIDAARPSDRKLFS